MVPVALTTALGTLLAMDNVVIINNVMIILTAQAILLMSALMMPAVLTIIHVRPQEITIHHTLQYASNVAFLMLSRLSSATLHLILQYFTR